MLWRHIFDGSKTLGKDLHDIAVIAASSGYKFLAFNGEILFLVVPSGFKATEVSCHYTGIEVQEIER